MDKNNDAMFQCAVDYLDKNSPLKRYAEALKALFTIS